MEVISQPRGTGKTTKLLGMVMNDENAVLIVSNESEKRRTRDLLYKAGHRKVVKIFTFEDLLRKELVRSVKPDSNIYIDEIGLFMSYFAGGRRIKVVTITDDKDDYEFIRTGL